MSMKIMHKITTYGIAFMFWLSLMLFAPWIILLDCIEQKETLTKSVIEYFRTMKENLQELIENPLLIEYEQ